MSEVLARFRDLKGIGPATEARLHEAGIYSWEALATAASALAAVGGGSTAKEVAGLVAAQRAEAGSPQAPRAPGAERLEAFVLRLAVTGDGDVLRSTVSHVRSADEQASACWDPSALARFVQQHAGLADTPAGRPPAAGRLSHDGPTTVVEPGPAGTRAPASPSRDHLVVLDAGKAIGGSERDVALTVDGLGALAGAGYRAELCTRRLGDVPPDAAWVVAARRAGPVPADGGGPVPLAFGPVRLPAGIHRLQVRLHLQLPAAVDRPPALSVV